ncbi:MAG: hypothetical protein NTZ32_08680 [Planctomycetales bacterium]|nr:hypothetical protein [Planctomycetales bacterium]
MRLSFELLEDVLRELRQSQDEDARPVISAVKSLDRTELTKLNLLLQSAGKIPVQQLIFASVTAIETDDTAREMEQAFERFIELGILSDDRGCARFRGDDFDRIVCKYAARQRKIQLSFEHSPVRAIFAGRILMSLPEMVLAIDAEDEGPLPGFFSVYGQRRSSEEQTHILSVAWSSLKTNGTVIDICRQLPTFVSEIYGHFASNEEELKSGLSLMRIDVLGSGVDFTSYFCRVHNRPNSIDYRAQPQLLEEMRGRAKLLGGSFEFDVRVFEGTTIDELLDLVLLLGDDRILAECAKKHAEQAVDAYINQNDKAVALIHAARAAKGIHAIDDDNASNIGYVFLNCNHLHAAADVLRVVAERTDQHSLAKYNLGIVRLLQSDRETAGRLFEDVLRIERETPFPSIGVLLIPEYSGGELRTIERWGKSLRENAEDEMISLSDAANLAIEVIKKMSTA